MSSQQLLNHREGVKLHALTLCRGCLDKSIHYVFYAEMERRSSISPFERKEQRDVASYISHPSRVMLMVKADIVACARYMTCGTVSLM